MISEVRVLYEGWGERWLWGTQVQARAPNGQPVIRFVYSDEAQAKGFELSAHTLPLDGPKIREGFPVHQLGLPGPIYDALPDGWGMLVMERLFKRNGLDAARMGPLARLSYIGDSAMGALSFEPVMDDDAGLVPQTVFLLNLAQEVQQVLKGEGGEFLARLLKMGGSPQGARPKLLLYRTSGSVQFSTINKGQDDAWLVKFPAHHEHPEVCAIEAVYARCLAMCGIDVPATQYIGLPDGLAAFASKRFDRQGKVRIPMQTLAAFTGADFRTPGALDYLTFLRATFACTHDLRQVQRAFKYAVFNVVFNNRDDHPKNFSYLMDKKGNWQLSPAYDVTFCEGPAGYHQMDVMGEALDISRDALITLGTQEAGMSAEDTQAVLTRTVNVAARFTQIAWDQLPGAIRQETLRAIQKRIDQNIRLLT